MSKYYTPELEEFNSGFRFETVSAKAWQDGPNYDKDKGWYLTDIDFLGFNLAKIEKAIKNNSIRVKYLYRQDIEELGWDFQHEDSALSTYFYHTKGNVYQLTKSEYSIKIIHKGLRKEDNQTLFFGEVKNYNELKKLMKQIGINEK